MNTMNTKHFYRFKFCGRLDLSIQVHNFLLLGHAKNNKTVYVRLFRGDFQVHTISIAAYVVLVYVNFLILIVNVTVYSIDTC